MEIIEAIEFISSFILMNMSMNNNRDPNVTNLNNKLNESFQTMKNRIIELERENAKLKLKKVIKDE